MAGLLAERGKREKQNQPEWAAQRLIRRRRLAESCARKAPRRLSSCIMTFGY